LIPTYLKTIKLTRLSWEVFVDQLLHCVNTGLQIAHLWTNLQWPKTETYKTDSTRHTTL